MSRLEILRYKKHQKAREDITEKDMARITEWLPLISDAAKAVSSSSYVTRCQSR